MRAINALREQNVHVLEVEQMQAIARDKCSVTDKDEFHRMIDYYHDWGKIVKHRNVVILDAKWLIELFKQLITISPFDEMVRNTQLNKFKPLYEIKAIVSISWASAAVNLACSRL